MKLSILSNVRTNNFSDAEVANKIGNAWGAALAQKELLVGNTYGVYHNYEGNYTNDYDLSICVAGELEGKEILEIDTDANYRVFKVESADNGVLNTWSHIWELEESGQLNRTYLKDFEVYTPEGLIEIHISIQ